MDPALVPARRPRPVAGEVSRPALVRRLRGRFDHPVTLVTAGAGFGKTTLLGQASRDNLLSPRGVDGWVTCDAEPAEPVRLAAAIVAALDPAGFAALDPAGVPGLGPAGVPAFDPGRVLAGGDPLRAVLGAFRRHAPLEVCLILDDAHELDAAPRARAFVADLLRALPATGHLVLAGRHVPDLPLARQRCHGEVLELGAAELAFTPGEVADLARRLGREPEQAAEVGGWPALVRLVLAARPATAWQFVREEVLAGLAPADRLGLAALALVGPAREETVAEVAGCPVDGAALAGRVPLVDVLDDGRLLAHPLWDEALARAVPAEPAARLCRRAIAVLAGEGRFARAGRLAVRSRDWRGLGELAVRLVHTTLSVTPPDLAWHWLAAVPADHRGGPEFVLLDAAARHGRDYTDGTVDGLADAAYRTFHDRGDLEAAAVALSLAVIAAHGRADLGRLAELAGRVAGLPTAPGSPVLTLAVRGTAAVLAELRGDPEGAIRELAGAPVDRVPPALALAVNRMHAHCLILAGRAAEAAELARRTLREVGDEHSRVMPALARWCAGDPAALPELRRPVRLATGDRDAFVEAAIRTVIRCSAGRADAEPDEESEAAAEAGSAGHAEGDAGAGDPAGWLGAGNARDAALAVNAAAALAVSRHDESRAAAYFAGFLARHPVTAPLGERHLRRFPALGYVLSPELRAHWDTVPLGPSHRAAREVARALLAVRAGTVPPTPGWPALRSALCFLPLAWSVELAARLAHLGSPDGPRLAGWLAGTLGPVVHDEVRRMAGTDRTRQVAARLLADLPRPPEGRRELAVLGPVRVAGGAGPDPPELRRARVRELLAALAVAGPLTREHLMDLLWPDHPPERARHNLRVTLSHARRLLEPDRAPGEAGYHLRVEGATVRLFPSPALLVDVWEFRRLLAEAGDAGRAGHAHRMGEALAAAVALWRGEPADLGRIAPLRAEVDALAVEYADALLTLGELRLVEGACGEAWTCAERALAVRPYDERAHRLAVAAALHHRDGARVAAAVAALRAALRALDVPPEPATLILLRQATGRAGAGSPPARDQRPPRRVPTRLRVEKAAAPPL